MDIHAGGMDDLQKEAETAEKADEEFVVKSEVTKSEPADELGKSTTIFLSTYFDEIIRIVTSTRFDSGLSSEV